MKRSDIKQGGVYVANVSGKKTKVRVDAIRETVERRYNRFGGSWDVAAATRYDVTNLATGRRLVFRSAQRFLRPIVCSSPVASPEAALLTPARRVREETKELFQPATDGGTGTYARDDLDDAEAAAVCDREGHVWRDVSHAGPNGGDADHECQRCGKYVHVPLY